MAFDTTYSEWKKNRGAGPRGDFLKEKKHYYTVDKGFSNKAPVKPVKPVGPPINQKVKNPGPAGPPGPPPIPDMAGGGVLKIPDMELEFGFDNQNLKPPASPLSKEGFDAMNDMFGIEGFVDEEERRKKEEEERRKKEEEEDPLLDIFQR